MRPNAIYAATAAAAAAALPSATLAFAPSRPSGPRRMASTSTSTSTSLSEANKESPAETIAAGGGGGGGGGGGTGWSIGAPTRAMEEAARKKRAARDALNKLLERQRRDVRQTMDLLENLEADYERFEREGESDFSFNATSSGRDAAAAATSIAASVAAGADYGYVSRSEGCRVESLDAAGYLSNPDGRFADYGPPGNVFALGSQQFVRNLNAMIGEYRDEESNPALTDRQRELQARLGELTLDSDAIWERERRRGEIVAPWIIKVPYFVLCYLLDVVFEGRNPFSRFFLLETVARMPYFSYITMLHLYETLGFWRRSADIKRIHFAEEWNEFHHLLIMESLGGDQPYWVRFMAQHSALAYYVALCVLWMLSPSLSYKFSEMLETHAVDTYGQFVDENEEKLRALPPSLAAVEYYAVGLSDPMFGEYQTASVSDPRRDGTVRRPGANLRSLYDVFVAIRNDEGDHVQTMTSCLDPKVATLSPGLESRVLTGVALAAGASLFFGSAGIDGIGALGESLGNAGVTGFEGMEGLADGAPDLDSIIAEDGPSGLLNAIAGGLAGLANGLQEMVGTEAGGIDDDAAGSALEDLAAGGMDGFELEAVFELVKNVLVGILELIGLGL